MGLLRDAIGSALGNNNVNTGLTGPKLPWQNNSSSSRTSSSLRPRYSASSGGDSPPPYDYPAKARYDTRQQNSQYSYRDTPYEQEFDYEYERRSRNDQETRDRRHSSRDQSYPQAFDYPVDNTDYNDNGYEDSRGRYQQPTYDPRPLAYSSNRSQRRTAFRPLALPQATPGDGQPFLRGYSDELRAYGIRQEDFIAVVDALNVANIPSPENAIFQKAANIGGFFVPGLGPAVGLTAGQVAVGVGAGYGHSANVAKVLSNANMDFFIPRGLELCMGKTQNLVAEIGGCGGYNAQYQSQQLSTDPMTALRSYGDLLAPLTTVLPPLQIAGRNDPIALLGNGITQKKARKAAEDAAKDAAEGKNKDVQKYVGGMKWLIVRQASPDAVAAWEQKRKQRDTAPSRRQ